MAATDVGAAIAREYVAQVESCFPKALERISAGLVRERVLSQVIDRIKFETFHSSCFPRFRKTPAIEHSLDADTARDFNDRLNVELALSYSFRVSAKP